jgi:monofunctional biosynthetic peptidoglycan transglycosylase
MATKKTSSKTGNKTFFQKLKTFVWKAMLWFFGLSIFSVIFFKWVPIPITPLMVSRMVESKLKGEEVIFSHSWVSLDEMSPNLPRAVIASEDGNFLTHSGFDFKAMQKAFENNNRGKKLKGGSTISQQTAKNVFLWQGRSYVRKAFEAYFTFLIELIWGKERIMEVYLNSIEMGNGVYGAKEAARHWYSKDVKDLSVREAAGIAAILPNPRKYKASHSSSYIERRKAKISRVMGQIGPIEY